MKIQIPNEFALANSDKKIVTAEDKDTRIEECGHCKETAAFKKDQHNVWHCTSCGQAKKNDMVPPFVRSLPYGEETVAGCWTSLKTAEKGIIYQNRRKRKKLKSIVDEIEKQRDIEDSAKALEIEG